MSRDGDDGWIVATTPGTEFRWRRVGGGLRAEWTGVVSLDVDDGGACTIHVEPGADPELVDKVRVTGVAAFLRALGGKPTLHGSAVARDGRAIVCTGDSGAGKSTAAATLCRVHGFELMADDAVGLEWNRDAWSVLPTESRNWLLPGGATRKAPVAATRSASARAALHAIVLLRPDPAEPAARLRRLHGREVYVALASNLVRFEISRPGCVQELETLATIAESAAIFELRRGPASRSVDTAALIATLACA